MNLDDTIKCMELDPRLQRKLDELKSNRKSNDNKQLLEVEAGFEDSEQVFEVEARFPSVNTRKDGLTVMNKLSLYKLIKIKSKEVYARGQCLALALSVVNLHRCTVYSRLMFYLGYRKVT